MSTQNLISPGISGLSIQPNAFLERVEAHFQRVLVYENSELLSKAKLCIPLQTLELRAIHRMREIQIHIKKGLTKELDMQFSDALLLELMNWFKSSFFKWVDKPPCRECSGPTKYSHTKTAITIYESIRVEVFKCCTCQVTTDFPRYNELSILLRTRKGRCGEWANCFALLCRALNFDTRLIVDTTDHVWVEVYSYTKKKWLHCDPCENILDSPLLYEAGWGKKLEYVMAYSKDDIQDVTWRYTSNHKATLQRRNRCSEQELINLIISLRNNRWGKLSDARRKFVCRRLCSEIVELMMERKAGSNEKVGRSSGSLSWRLQRRETKPWTPHVWKYTDHKEICIKYSTSLDMYEVLLPDGTVLETIKQWMNGAFAIQNIVRKEENDWRMVYLAREESDENAEIKWKILTHINMVIDSVNIEASSKTFGSGNVDWIVSYEDVARQLPTKEHSNVSFKNLGVKELTLTAHLHGGEGRLAWQHTQIFRQEMCSSDYPLQITVKFKTEEK